VKGDFIVSFFGACLKPRLCLVMEFCPRGSLYDLLKDLKFEFKWETFWQFCNQILKGIQVLHDFKPQILHRDVKSMNFLVTADCTLKGNKKTHFIF
jgi:serine/threonine protein kinase